MATTMRSNSRASVGWLDLGEELQMFDGGLLEMPSTRTRKRSRKDDVALDESKKQDTRGGRILVVDLTESTNTTAITRINLEDVCWICKKLEALDPFRIGCGHTFCRSCIVDCVRKVVVSQKAGLNVKYSASQLVCPKTGCESELSQRELTSLLGSEEVRVYEKWLASVVDKFYRPYLMYHTQVCSNVQCTQGVPSLTLSSRVWYICVKSLRHALQVRGIQGTSKFKKQECVQLLLNTVGLQETDLSKEVWICTTCEGAWCVACGVQIPPISNAGKSKDHAQCEGVQGLKIYKSLVDLNKVCSIYIRGQQTHSVRNSTTSRVSGNTIWAVGTGYGGERVQSNNRSEAMHCAARRAELELDSRVEKQFILLTGVLRGEDGRSSRLSLATCALLKWNNILSQLLRQLATNDSMWDISERSGLYLKMVDLLKAISMHDELLPLLTLPEEKDEDKDNTVMRKMANIYKQAKVMLQQMQSNSLEGTAATDVDMSLARELCQCHEVLVESATKHNTAELGVSGRKPQSKEEEARLLYKEKLRTLQFEVVDMTDDVLIGSATKEQPTEVGVPGRKPQSKEEEARSLYKEKLRALQFRQVDMTDGKGAYRHYFKDHISKCIDKRGPHNRQRMLHLSKEIATLAGDNTLPLEWESSIHLCVDESRVDVMRAMIVGPQETPYKNGLFLFDIFLPPDYPQVPPKVHFLTTGGGTVRFNPNLYNTGLICLSLLGTWSGPGWIPWKSTLLQVLVSIQSLILVKDPYYNEPGFEQRGKCPQAELENSSHRLNTLSFAVLGALRKPDPHFADLVREHFLLKREEIAKQCNEWIAVAGDVQSKNRITNIAKEVKAELERLCSLK